MSRAKRTAYVAFGLQSSGSTMISYCFLQRDDLAGPLDWFHDRLPEPDEALADGQAWWCKTTIASFRATEVIDHLADFGIEARPLLIVRDTRRVFDSLLAKPYGKNATTAEDPPLRTRMRRFLADWHWFRAKDLPILRYESFLEAPKDELRRACDLMGLAWDPAMVDWPKSTAAIWNRMGGNDGFLTSIAGSLTETIRAERPERPLARIRRDDLVWLEETFAEYNLAHRYPPSTLGDIGSRTAEGWSEPRFDLAGRYPRVRRNRAFRRLLGPAARFLRRPRP